MSDGHHRWSPAHIHITYIAMHGILGSHYGIRVTITIRSIQFSIWNFLFLVFVEHDFIFAFCLKFHCMSERNGAICVPEIGALSCISFNIQQYIAERFTFCQFPIEFRASPKSKQKLQSKRIRETALGSGLNCIYTRLKSATDQINVILKWMNAHNSRAKAVNSELLCLCYNFVREQYLRPSTWIWRRLWTLNQFLFSPISVATTLCRIVN